MREGSDDPLISRNCSLIEAEVDGEMVALHVETGVCLGFNGTAYRVWQLSEPPIRLSELCATLTRQFDVDAAICERDVRDLLGQLARDGLMTLA